MVAVHHLGICLVHVLITHIEYSVVCITAKFGYDRCNSFDNMNFQYLVLLAGRPIHAPKIGF